MYSIQEQFKTDALAQMNDRVRNVQLVAGNILDLSREIGVLNIRTTKASTEQFAGAVRKLLDASNPAEFMQIATSVMQPDMQLWTSYLEQLRSIADKAGAPVKTSLALSASTLLAPQAAPLITWPKPAAPAPQPAANAAPAAEAPVLPEQAQLEAAIEPAPEVPPPATVPYAVAPEESSEDAPQPAAATPPAAVEAITEVAEAMTGANKTPDVVMAASALLPEEPAVPEITVVRKTAASLPASKPAAAPASKKAAPARSASHRGRKG
jgi:hypothetical protein